MDHTVYGRRPSVSAGAVAGFARMRRALAGLLLAGLASLAAAPAAEAQTPAAPSNFRLGTGGFVPTASTITVFWNTYSVSNFLHFQVQYKASTATDWVSVLIHNPTATNYRATGVDPLTTYSLRLRACTGSIDSPTCSAWTPNNNGLAAKTLAGPPTNLRFTAGTTAFSATWTAPAGGTVGEYRYQAKPSSSESWGNESTITFRQGNVTGLSSATAYDFRVRACETAGDTGTCSADYGTGSTATLAGAPTDLRVRRSTFANPADPTTGVFLDWTAPSGDAIDGYEYAWKRADEADAEANWQGTETGDTTSTAVQGLPADVALDFRVRARTAGDTDTSDRQWSGTFRMRAPLGKPTGLDESRAADGTCFVTVSWTAPTDLDGGTITDYAYRVSLPDGTQTDEAGQELGSTATSSGFPTSIEGRVFQVRAITGTGGTKARGPWSEPFAVPVAPSAVTFAPSRTALARSGTGNSAALTASLDRCAEEDTVITVAAAPSGAVTLSGTVLTIPAGDLESTGAGITVTAAPSGTDTSVTLSGTAAPSAHRTGPAAVTLTIEGDPVTNTAAEGTPSITGTPQVGQTLTAGPGTIADDDGLTGVSYSWQWIRVDGSTETAIPGATSTDYTPVDADLGRTLRVRASFTDDVGNAESLTSTATAAVTAAGTPTITLVLTRDGIDEKGSDNSAILTATLSSAVSGSATTITVVANPAGAVDLSGTTLTIPAGQTESSGAGITVTAVDNEDDAPDAVVRVTLSGSVTESDRTGPAAVTLGIVDDDDGQTVTPGPGPGGDTGSGDGGLPPANNPATGAPAITGTPAVGQTLTARRGTIADADGLAGVGYAWQWIRLDGATETDIAGATGPTYRIADADLGRTLKVRASFTDDAGNAESLTSVATATVVEDARTTRVTTAVEGALAAVTRRAVTSALDTIGSRLSASMSANSLTLAGEAVSPGGASATAMAGLAPPCPPGAVDAHGVGTAFGAARFGAADGCMGAGRTRSLAAADLLHGSAFSLALGAAEGSPGFDPSAARWSLWGRGDLGSFEGRPESGMRYDGDLTTGWLGIDARAGAWVAGVAVSHGTGDATYAFEDAAGAGQGRLEASLTAIYPYGRWTVAEGLEVHGVLGAGQGEARHGLHDDPAATSDLSMQMASIGLRHDLPALAGIDLAARADVHVARLETEDGPDYIHGLTADSWRARAGLEASRQIVLDGNAALTPFVEAAARRDGGDGLEGSGLEVAGGLRYTAPRLELEARGRWLAAHSEDGAEEQGVSLTARVGPGAQGRGLSLALNPRWGAATGGAGALWREELPTTAGTPAGAALDARVGYGVVLPPYGVLTPFALTGLEDADRQRVGIGVRFAAPHLHFDVEVAGDHREGGAAGPEQVLGVDLGLRF